MPVKYQCPKCGRRFAEWGAEKLGFKCPADDSCPPNAGDEVIELVRVGTQEEKTPRKTTLKRVPRRAVAGVPASDVDELFGEEAEDFDGSSDSGDDDEIEVSDEEEEEFTEATDDDAAEAGDVEGDDVSDEGDEDFDGDDEDVEVSDEEDEEI